MFFVCVCHLQLTEPVKTPENNRRSGSKRTISMAQTPNPNPVPPAEKISPLQKQQKTNETPKDAEFLRKSTEAVNTTTTDVEEDDDEEEEEEVSPLRKQRRTIESQDNVVATRKSKDRRSIEKLIERPATRRSKDLPNRISQGEEELLVSPDKISPLRKSAKAKENAENITPPRPTKSPNYSPKSTESSPKRTPTKRAAVSPVASSRNTRNAAKKLYHSSNRITRGRQNEETSTTTIPSSLAKALFPKKLTTAKVSKIPVKRNAVTSTTTSDPKEKSKQQTSLPANNNNNTTNHSTSTMRTRIPTTTSSKATAVVSRIALKKRKT